MKKLVSDNEILNSFSTIAEYLPKFFDDAIAIAITDNESFIFNKSNPELPMNADVGDKIPEGTPIRNALKTGEPIIKEVPEKVYGVPFKSYAVPVKDENGKVAGCIVLGKSISKKKEMANIVKALSSSFDQISLSINSVSAGVQKVADMNLGVLDKVQHSEANSKNTDEILSFIKGFVSKTNMLGLNAEIEAARSGEIGKGFTVVAAEIRKLSTSISESVKKIDFILKDISVTTKSVNEEIVKSSDVFKDEVAALKEVTAAIENLNSTTHMLKELSEKI